MSNFVKVGKYRINLDQVTCVTETKDGVRVFYPHAVGDSYAYDDLRGDQAKLLLAIIDQDDELVDELYQRQYAQSKPKEPALEAADAADTSLVYPINFMTLNQS